MTKNMKHTYDPNSTTLYSGMKYEMFFPVEQLTTNREINDEKINNIKKRLFVY